MPKNKQPDERAVPDIKHLWRKDVADHDYDAAFDFLRLRVGIKRAKALIKRLRRAELVQMRANDILRACELPALDLSDPGTHHNMVSTILGKPLSPVLVVSLANGTSRVADGYHRVSWAYQNLALGLRPGQTGGRERLRRSLRLLSVLAASVVLEGRGAGRRGGRTDGTPEGQITPFVPLIDP